MAKLNPLLPPPRAGGCAWFLFLPLSRCFFSMGSLCEACREDLSAIRGVPSPLPLPSLLSFFGGMKGRGRGSWVLGITQFRSFFRGRWLHLSFFTGQFSASRKRTRLQLTVLTLRWKVAGQFAPPLHLCVGPSCHGQRRNLLLMGLIVQLKSMDIK